VVGFSFGRETKKRVKWKAMSFYYQLALPGFAPRKSTTTTTTNATSAPSFLFQDYKKKSSVTSKREKYSQRPPHTEREREKGER